MDIEIRLTNPGETFAADGTLVESDPGDVLLHIIDGDDHKTILFEPEDARAAAMALMQTGAKGLQAKYGPVEALKRILTGKSITKPEIMDPDHA